MEIIRTIKDMQEYSIECKRRGEKIGFVPTMGYLHEGHLSLVDIARKYADRIIMSIFVNPLQFGPNEDYEKYPRNIERDERLARERGVDAIFYPDVKEMYPDEPKITVSVKDLNKYLCGASRPGHFEGVVTVVAKLFNIVLPDIAIFGQKDYQQYIIIKRMVKDLNFPVKIIKGPIVREYDGLAMSSRNTYLNREEREVANYIYKGLQKALEAFKKGKKESKELKRIVEGEITKSPLFKVDYIEIVDGEKLKPKTRAEKGDVIAIAVFLGKTRLIDNIILE